MQSSQQKDEDKLCHSKLFMCNPREMVQDKKLQISALRSTLTQADVTGSTEQLSGYVRVCIQQPYLLIGIY